MNNNIESLDFSADSGSENRAGKYTNFYDVRFPFIAEWIISPGTVLEQC